MSATAKVTAVKVTTQPVLPIFKRPEGDTGIPKVRQVHGPITVMIRREKKCKAKNAMVKWGATFSNGEKSLGWECSGGGGDVALADEGITWIRGHHAQDSEEVAALMVAHALGRTA